MLETTQVSKAATTSPIAAPQKNIASISEPNISSLDSELSQAFNVI